MGWAEVFVWLFQKVHGTFLVQALGGQYGHYQKSSQIFALAEVFVIIGAGTRDQNTKISKWFREELGKAGAHRKWAGRALPMPALAGTLLFSDL